MPRRRRMLSVGQPCHCVNRGQDGRMLFAEHSQYQHFIDLMIEGKRRYPIRFHGYCLIGSHFHKLLTPAEPNAVSAYMQWIQGRYGFDLRYDRHDLGQGHIFQRRFWSESIGFGPFHYINVLRYIEANPVAAGLVQRAEDWKWSSLWERQTLGRSLLDPSPMIFPEDWLDQVNRPQPAEGSDPNPPDDEIVQGSDPSRSRRRRGRTRVLLPKIG